MCSPRLGGLSNCAVSVNGGRKQPSKHTNLTYHVDEIKKGNTVSDPTWLTGVLRAAGLEVEELAGAYERGHGDFGYIWGCMDHHTGASGNSSAWSIAEHPDLGLASQLFLNRAGKYYLCGVGIAWHAGQGSWPGIARDNANQVTIGTEADNNGTEGWGAPQYWAYVRGQAAILNHLGYGPDRSIGHKEWAGPSQGKWDPGGMNMDKFRADIGNVQRELRGEVVKPPENMINTLYSFSPWLGKRLFDGERNTRGHDGKYVDFANGTAYWNVANGAIAVPAYLLSIYKKYDYEAGFLGMPKRFHAIVPNVGEIQGFDGGIILRKYAHRADGSIDFGAGDGFAVHGQIGDRWFLKEGAERGHLGWPTSDEYKIGDVIVQDFEGGQLLCDLNGTVKVAKGDTTYVPPGR